MYGPTPISFVVCVSDDSILAAHLLASPCLGPGSPHEIIAVRNAPSAAEGLNSGLERAKHALVVCVHQDVYLPEGWDERLVSQYRLAQQTLGTVGVAGIYGVGEAKESPGTPLSAVRIGHVIDRGRTLHEGAALPVAASTLDELLLVLPRGTPLRFDPALGFHLYGADICLQAREQGVHVAVLDALCHHHSKSIGLPQAFFPSARAFAREWASRLPVATPCVIFDREGRMSILGNAAPGTDSVAFAEGEPLTMPEPAAPDGRAPKRSPALASIIVPCFNQLAFTRNCVRALLSHTRPAWELIVIDNGSTDGTAAYLAGVQDAAGVPINIISNKTNLGFPAAVNQGLKAAGGEYLVLLNNDAVVTDAWLDQLIALTEMRRSHSPIGMTGPMSNYVTPPQLVENVPYRDMPAMEQFARRWREQHRGQWSTASKLSGFCLLMKRAVYDAVGGLDERFGLGFFDDDDLAVRARHAGFELAIAHDLFIHHFGSRTFVGSAIDSEALLAENAKRFAAKWGQDAPVGQRIALRPWAENQQSVQEDTGQPQGERPKARVTLAMIVRNEEDNLPLCLRSVQNLFDEIVIVDTGSTDRTRQIALEFGARVIEFTWIDDFAAARNVSLENATGDYIFWLDADDVVDPPERKKLESLFGRLGTDRPAAYVVRCSCDPSAGGTGGETIVDHIRLFPRRGDVRWTYRVHEQILPALRRADVPVEWTEVTVRHTGYIDLALRARKLDRDTRILQVELAERPHDPFVLFNLGAIAIEREQWQEALDYLCRSLRGSAPTDSITRKLFALIGRAHQMLGHSEAALSACIEGLSFDPEDAELWFRKAVLHHQRKEFGDAEASWRRILHLKRPDKFCSVDQGIYGHLTRRNLAVLAGQRGDFTEAVHQWRAVLQECPGDVDATEQIALLAKVSRSAQTTRTLDRTFA
jgi:glycosyltransferase involved in cell wall biosynthesis